MAATTAIVAGASAFAGGVTNALAIREQNKAQRKAGSLERAAAEIDRQQQTRRAIALRRQQEAQILASQESTGTSTNSGVSGSVGSLRTQTAVNIGANNTQFASQIAQSRTLQQGATRAAGLGQVSSAFGGIQQGAQAIAGSPQALKFLKTLF